MASYSPFIELDFDYGETIEPRYVTALVRKKHVRSLSFADGKLFVSLQRTNGQVEGHYLIGNKEHYNYLKLLLTQ